jgi:hypothetical protein
MVSSRPGSTSPSRRAALQREIRAFLELAALSGVAVAQPAFDILESNAEIFVRQQTKPIELFALVILLVLVPPAVLWAIEVACALVLPRLRRHVHALLAGAVISVIVVELVKDQTDLGPVALVLSGLLLGLGGAWLVLRFETIRLWLRFLAAAPAIFAVMFLFSSPVSTAVLDADPGAVDVSVGAPSRIVMVVLDELPTQSLLDGAGRIDAELFPSFAELARRSTWYRNHTTVAPNTTTALPAIMTGLRPTDLNAPTVAAHHPRNIFTLLANTYDLNVHESWTRLCPRNLCAPNQPSPVARRPFRQLLSVTVDMWRDFASPQRREETIDFTGGKLLGDPEVQQTAQNFVASLAPTSRPRLDFLHLLLPHQSWYYLPTGQDYRPVARDKISELHGDRVIGAPRGLGGDYSWESEWTSRLGRQRHLLQLAATDRILGQIIARLKTIGAYDDSLVVVTADHGVAFGAGNPIRGLSRGNYAQIAWVPLFVKTPAQQTPVVSDAPARTIDVLPTIADSLELRLPWKTDGRSLGEPSPADQPVELLDFEYNHWRPPPGHNSVTVPARTGFDEVLRGRASPAEGDPAFRLYRVGKYAGLFGQRTERFEAPQTDAPTGTIARSEALLDVDPQALHVPWASVEGTVQGAELGAPLVIAVNGVVAGFSATARASRGPDIHAYWTVVPPQLFRPGTNEIGLFLAHGPAEHPTLVPVRLQN